jgi:hypothetical protein
MTWEVAVDDRGRGWLVFSAVVLGVGGIMRIFDSIWVFRYHNALPENFQGPIFGHNLKTYGWVWLAVGITLVLSAFAVLQGSEVGRWVGVAAGAIVAITAVFWLPYYPVWSILYTAIGVAVIYGMTAYGGHVSATE